ncbi:MULTISPECIES: class I SAM-dependent methyltransferase [unclassified Streptomyces]|uniref:SAM-dependent methyltransferase n=1 Tax=unclassified Streptomyces TaxID=2593676 RepID=UPI000DBA659C|nr:MULTISPECIES: class I SAM-dependent methyltransferase [unclassified Streptomyces]MYT71419.1 methyltransferase domain-containing protein [Streptomyces sp. SID8367]RAJ82880.1 methyltransferase family protein [Streptomyces sp. PsTaAH-137]
MTETQDLPPRLTSLTFHGPLSEPRAADLVERLALAGPSTVLDIGCGWGELMLRVLEAAPKATGRGIDLNADDLARGRTNAATRGLADRVEFLEQSATDAQLAPADLVLCLSASHALSGAEPPHHTTEALHALRRLVTPGGRVLLAEGYWQRPPTRTELDAMWPDAGADEYDDLAGLVDRAVEAGFRPAWVETANRDEWEAFESGYQSDKEVWLATHPDHPLAEETRDKLDSHRANWLRGYRDVLGIAYLTLVPVG